MKLLCVNGIPARALFSGSIYTQVDSWRCCARFKPGLVSIAEAVGHLEPDIVCGACLVTVPRTETGWFNTARFVPWHPPAVSLDEITDLFQPKKVEA